MTKGHLESRASVVREAGGGAAFRSGRAPGRPPAACLLVAVLALAGCGKPPGSAGPPDVAALKRDAIVQANDPDRLLRTAESLRRAGESGAALQALTELLRRRPQDVPVAAAVAELLQETGQPDAARQLSRQVLDSATGSADALAARALLLLAPFQYGRSAGLAKEAVELDPKSARAWRIYARTLALQERLEEAWAAYPKAVALAPDDAGLLADYGAALSRYGRTTEAESVLRRALAVRPADPRVLRLLGEQVARRARTPAERAEAEDLLQRAAAGAPDDVPARIALGRLHLDGGDAAGALGPLEECRRLAPANSEPWLLLGQAYQAAGRVEESRKALAEFRRLADYQREVGHLELRLSRDPKSVETLLRLADLHARHGRPEAALPLYRQAQAVRPNPAIEKKLRALSSTEVPDRDR